MLCVEKKSDALLAARGYCLFNGLSISKLETQDYTCILGNGYFMQKSDVLPDGLLNDIATQPRPTLIIIPDGVRLSVQETEYTRKYLSDTE